MMLRKDEIEEKNRCVCLSGYRVLYIASKMILWVTSLATRLYCCQFQYIVIKGFYKRVGTAFQSTQKRQRNLQKVAKKSFRSNNLEYQLFLIERNSVTMKMQVQTHANVRHVRETSKFTKVSENIENSYRVGHKSQKDARRLHKRFHGVAKLDKAGKLQRKNQFSTEMSADNLGLLEKKL